MKKVIMVAVRVEILKIIDDCFPVFVKYVLVNWNGVKHDFRDKLPVFSLDYDIEIPCMGEM